MNTDLERDLRVVLEELVNADPPTGVAARAIASGKRRRRLMRGGSVLAALAVAGTVTLSVVLAGPDNAAPPIGPTPSVITNPSASATPSAAPSRELTHVVLVYGGLPDGPPSPAGDYSLVLNTSTGEYERMPYHTVVPSPDGSRLFVVEGDNGEVPTRMGILDRASGNVTWLSGDQGYRYAPQWSPDGSTVLLTEMDKDDQHGFVLVDAATATETYVPVPSLFTDNPLRLGLSFAADGAGILRIRAQGSGDEGNPSVRLTAIERYGLDGQLVGSVPIAIDNVRWLTMSDDRTRLWAVLAEGSSGLAVISTTDGSTIATLDGLLVQPILWADAELAITSGGSVYTVNGGLSGRIPARPGALGVVNHQSLVVRPAAGLPSTVANLAF